MNDERILATPPSSIAELSPPLTPEQKPVISTPISELPPPFDINVEKPTDVDIEDNYIQRTLANAKPRPPITWKNLFSEINYISSTVLLGLPFVGLYGFLTTNLQWKTAIFSIIYYFITGFGITAGYHRLWSHRSYNPSKPLEYFLCLAGSGSCQGC